MLSSKHALSSPKHLALDCLGLRIFAPTHSDRQRLLGRKGGRRCQQALPRQFSQYCLCTAAASLTLLGRSYPSRSTAQVQRSDADLPRATACGIARALVRACCVLQGSNRYIVRDSGTGQPLLVCVDWRACTLRAPYGMRAGCMRAAGGGSCAVSPRRAAGTVRRAGRARCTHIRAARPCRR